MRLVLAAATLAALAACGDSEPKPEQDPTTSGPEEPAAVELVPTPPDALRACRRSPLLRRACPQQVPEAPFDPDSEIYQAHVFPSGPGGTRTFNLSWGGEYPRPERNRPPALVHIVLVGGRPLGPLEGIDIPQPRRAELRDGLLHRSRGRALSFGTALWHGLRGRLLLAPPYPRGGIMGNHLVFRWRDGKREYALSLHAWEPLTETAETLRRVVASAP
ncbi:MAG: hypothetical protein ACRDON_08460 [Gaiellaceae bacterium]